MGARRAGYFVGLVIMILGIIMVPSGLIMAFGGIFDSVQTGDVSMLTGGVVLVVLGVIMFVVGLVPAIVLKKSGGENVNITISGREGFIETPESDPMLNLNRQDMLGSSSTQDSSVLDVIQDPKQLSQENKGHGSERRQNVQEHGTAAEPPLEEDEEVSMQDMIMDLQESGRGEKARLEYIARRLDGNRTIYNSDSEYVKKQFASLRAEITKREENTDPN